MSSEVNKSKILNIILICLLGLTIIVYLCISYFFSSHFYYGTIIDNKDFSFKTISDVQNYMQDKVNKYELTIEEKNDIKETILGEDILLTYNESDIEEILESQNAFLWPFSFFKEDNTETEINAYYDENKFNEIIKTLSCTNQSEQVPPTNAFPIYQNGEFIIQEEKIGTQLDLEKFYEELNKMILSFNPKINLEQSDCYLKPQYFSYSPEVKNACSVMNGYCNANITYEISNNITEVVNKDIISEWLICDDNMNVSINNEAVENYVSELASKYDTIGTTRTIESPRGKIAKVSGGTYGWKINQSEEINSLINDIKNMNVISRKPVYKQKAASRGNAEWGSTYLEVDLTEQYMWYIKDGNIALETDVVTGANVDNRETPSGIYEILEKKSPKILVGELDDKGKPIYETPVKYWMRVTWTGVGFHDAVWQPNFGGNLYVSGYGSHGCINMPYEKAGELYDMLSRGCPVVIHY